MLGPIDPLASMVDRLLCAAQDFTACPLWSTAKPSEIHGKTSTCMPTPCLSPLLGLLELLLEALLGLLLECHATANAAEGVARAIAG